MYKRQVIYHVTDAVYDYKPYVRRIVDSLFDNPDTLFGCVFPQSEKFKILIVDVYKRQVKQNEQEEVQNTPEGQHEYFDMKSLSPIHETCVGEQFEACLLYTSRCV